MINKAVLRDIFARVQAGALSRTDALRLIQQSQGNAGAAQPAPAQGAAGTWLWTPRWAPRPVSRREVDRSSVRWVTLAPVYQAHLGALKARAPEVHWDVLPDQAAGESIPDGLVAAGEQLLVRVQAILQGKPHQAVLFQVIVDEDGALAALTGLLKSASRENPKLVCQVIALPRTAGMTDLVQAVEDNASPAAARDAEIRYTGGTREVRVLEELADPGGETLPWKDGGVYLITGGAGGLAWILANEIAQRARGARIVLAGRSAPPEALRAQLDAWNQRGDATQIAYRVLDVTVAPAVDQCVGELLDRHGSLSGVIHCAGVIHDNFILKKRPEELRAVLAPKVAGAVHLDRATRDLDLDCFLLFSSAAAVFGVAGQSDYALANAFLDRFAAQRNAQGKQHRGRGRALSVNWPLWDSGGMRMDEVSRDVMHRHGFAALSTADGITALYRAWASRASQVVVVRGERQAARALVEQAREDRTSLAAAVPVQAAGEVANEVEIEAPVAPGALDERTLHRLRRMLGEVTKLGTEKIDAHEPFQGYGIDSFMVAQMNLRLAEVFADLSKTLLYEYPTLAQLGQYLVRDHREACIRWTGLHEPASPPPASQPAPRRTHREPKGVPARGPRDGIAIIGMTGRYPRARTLSAYWEVLQAGTDCIGEIPADRWPLEEFFEPDVEQAIEAGRSYCKWGGFLEGSTEFDPLFFNISPREAADIDPQERLFLQAAWEVVEDAGYTRARLRAQHRGRVGVYVGITKTGFSLHGPALWQTGSKAYPNTSFASVANRVSYLLDLHGPSMPIDTMCSASLTAIHEACEHLARGECELAIAGGVNLYLHPSSFQALCAQRMLSRDGRCKSFGAGANGFVPGEGVGALLLKPLQRALADRDHIHGVIRGTSVNHGGKTSGYTVPNPAAQGEVVAAALHKAGIHPRTVGYIEAHGTGTELGDPIEITGLTQAFSRSTKDRQFCAIGSAKSNIGHLESAAGIAGVTKVLLQMKHRILVPSLHAEALNPLIDFARTPFRVQQTAGEWQRPVIELDGVATEVPRIAGISSFGAGGANAHVILEEHVEQDAGTAAVPSRAHPALLVLSAKTEAQLKDQAERLLAHLSAAGNPDLFDIAYTLQVGREAMEHRLAFTATTIDELADKLSAHLAGTLGDLEECYRGTVKHHKDTVAVFDTDEALQHAVATWIEQGKYARLLEMWVKGLAVDWDELYGDGAAPRRISLPTYPFARERYWIEVPDPAPSARRPDASPPASSLLFVEDWVDAGPEAAPGAEPRTLVVVLSDRPWQRAIATELRRLGASVKLAFLERSAAGDAELAGDDGLVRHRVVRGDARSHGDAFRQIVERWGAPDVVWDLAGLEDPADIADPGAIVDVLQGVAGANIDSLKVLLAGEYRTALERCYLEAWVGFERSVQRALPDVQVALVHAERTGTTSKQWLDRLWRESRADRLESALYLGDQRQVLRCREDRAAAPSGAPVLRHGGSYLITGGLGGLGYLFAQQLARHWSASLILTGRSALDAGGQAKLDALAALGGRALYVAADAGDKQQMRVALERGLERFGELAGVIHAAGVASSASLVAQTRSSTAAVWTPKITGTVVLGELLEGRDLDFVCCFSSSAAMLGDFGSCDYAVGSRFQLAYARYMTGRTLAICWPLWADGGMRLPDDATQLYLESSGQRALPAAEGLALFEQLLARQRATGLRHGLVMAGDRGRMSALLGVTAPARADGPRSGAAGQRGARDGVLAELKDQVSALQKIPGDKLDVGANLADFGFDSVGLVALAKRLSARFGIALQASVFFSHATLQRLADYLVAAHAVLAPAAPAPAPAAPAPAAPEPAAPARAAAAVAPKRAAGDERIAIVGMSGRASGARSVDEMWRILAGGECAIQEIPLSRFDWRDSYQAVGDTEASAATAPGKTCSKWMGIVPGVEEFDAAFFEVSPREARAMDPRQRLLLQEAFIALEDAGFGATQLARDTVGMFVGVEQGDYQLLVGQQGSVTGNHDAILAARLSYFLDLRGPAMAINTACSSGLVALHQACSSLRAGECDAAIAAGVNLILTPVSYLGMSQAGMLSPTGTCAAFDRRANGLVPGEAVVAVVLKRLSQAEADGDRIHAVIRGSGINYDGKTNGLTAPSGAAQTDLIQRVHARAGVSAGAIEYIVTHGTGTRLGDPVEIHALRDAFGRGEHPRVIEPSCALTSTKTNFGHTFAASGLVSLISLVQALRHDTIPASLHCEQPSDYIDWHDCPFYVCTQNRPWPRTEGKRRLGAVSAFGMSGTNAHVIVESHDAPERAAGVEAPYTLLAVSAKTGSALARRIGDLVALLRDPRHTWDGPGLAAMSHTLLDHRQHFAYRCAVVAANRDQAVSLLEQAGAAERPSLVLRGTVARERVENPELREAAMRSLDELAVQRTEPERYRQALLALGELYCQGYQLEWRALFGERLPRRIALPAYPFAADRHWVTGERPASAAPVVHEDALSPVTEVPMPFDEPEKTESKPRGIALRSLHEVASSEAFVTDEPTPLNDEAFASKDTAPKKAAAPAIARVSLQELEQELRVSLAKALYAQPNEVDLDTPFNELGLDSIIGVEWVHTLNAVYGLTLSATKIYAHPTIRELAKWLSPQIPVASGGLVAIDPPAAVSIPRVDQPRPIIEPSVASEERRPQEASPGAVESSAEPAVSHAREPIAIVGMSGRYPGSRDLAAYWENLAEGKNCVQEIPASRWKIEDYYDPEPGKPGKTCCKWLGRLDDVECFDSLFFNISPAEAQAMDPQQRLFLEEAYRAFQDAGYNAQRLNNRKCGVYLGIASGEYGLLIQQVAPGQGDATGASAAMAAARIAYYLNLKGPAIPIDTACSASLVATHLACQALRAHEVEMALVGGVALYLTPQWYIGLSAAGMFSPDGRCKTFDNSADGFVPGEGVGTLVLKRLCDAEADGDLIHGVIIGSGINQDGKTNGITAPNLVSQMELVRDIYARYDIHPESIGYVEMHGTGTKLGDPIELEALATAYREKTQRKGYCAIGSVKSNIGHTSAAAGVAGVHKVLLALQHGELPATLHFRTPNEHFDFASSPFRVNSERCSWEANGALRRAAVSSFGYSGTNAHVVIQEYRGPALEKSRRNAREPVVILLSARSRERLHEQARLLRAHLEQPMTTDADLAAIAYTLQVGRDAMEHRMALVADTKERALHALSAFLDNEVTGGEVFIGQIGKTDERASLLDSDEDAGDLVETWLRKRKLKQLAQVWVRGLGVEWSRLYPDGKPRLVRLPAYPFARRRHWVESSAAAIPRVQTASLLHPLLQRNTSDSTVQRYSSTLSGEEFYLKDHIVNGRKLLPAVCYLEMARAAMASSGGAGRRGAHIRLQNVVWLEPVSVDEASEVHITLRAAPNDEIEFAIYTNRQADIETPLVHAQGRALWVDAKSTEAISVDIDALRRRCDRSIDVARCYEAFSTMGIAYGPAHRGLTSIHAGVDADGQPLVVAQAALPGCVSETRDQYVLHPSVLDSALQAGIGFSLEGPTAGRDEGRVTKALPFAVESVEILGRSSEAAWVVVRPSASRALAAEGMTKLDVDVCDQVGRVCVRLRGFTSRTTTKQPSARIDQPQSQPQFQPQPSLEPSDRLRARTVAALKKLASQALKLSAHEVDENEPLEKYGIDSILVVKLTKGLKEFFPDLSSTLFFEHRTIAAAAEHFIHSDEAAVRRWVGLEHRRESAPASRMDAPARRMNGHAPGVTIVQERAAVVAPAPSTHEGIAIIGMSGRYPQARDVREYWENLKAGRHCIREIPAERWDHRRYYDPQKGKLGKSYSKWGGFIDDIDRCDPLFFRISPKEAEQMDPQERLFLQEAYASIEDAGYTQTGLCASRKVGVYVGVMNSTYQRNAAYWSIANRVSYLFDLHGPSMAVDTACSSSLTAIHLAVEAIQHGSCEMAIAGGVQLIVDPVQYTNLSAATMLSMGDRCKAFGARADGFVDGEGVGAIVLKPLSRAVQDGDHIYGVIRGSAVNAGGKTNGYTVPNPTAQREVVQAALAKAGVDARTVSYVEAHGTGTELGDPIEIAGLTQAFSAQTSERQYCAIGSVKSNIGHLESAAGIAAVTKVLLQLQARTLVPSLHSEELNPHIDFTRTPFRVQQELAEWERPVVRVAGEARAYPRIAGVSSFGAGGANAHVVIEEYCGTQAEQARSGASAMVHPAMIVLSAKGEQQLKEQAQRLLAHVSRQEVEDSELAGIAHTLQVGREAMEQRLAFTAATIRELQSKLNAFVAGREIEDFYRGESQRNKEALSIFDSDELLKGAVRIWLEHGEYAKLLGLWVKGLAVDWSALYPHGTPRRVSLPTYPFARERHWLESGRVESGRSGGAVQAEPSTALHPLVHRNTSTVRGQRFSATWSGEEFFLSDHRVAGLRTLPGVAYLEMARAALAMSLEDDEQEATVFELRQVVWIRPIQIEHAQDVHIRLHENERREIEFEIYTTQPDATGAKQAVGHAQGHAQPLDARRDGAELPHAIDVLGLRDRCEHAVDIAELYAAFAAMGIEYGPAHRALTSVQVGTGTDGQRFVLAHVTLPEHMGDTAAPYVLHPSILDGALQASLAMAQGNAMAPMLPFALERLQVLDRSPASAWVVIRGAEKLEIDICDESGRPCVRMQGFSARAVRGKLESSAPRAERDVQVEPTERTVLLSPRWEAQQLPDTPVWPAASSRVVLVGGAPQQQQVWRQRYAQLQILQVTADTSVKRIADAISAYEGVDHVVWLAPVSAPGSVTDESIIEAQHTGVIGLYRLIKALLLLGYDARPLGLTVVTWRSQAVGRVEWIDPTHAGVHGLIGSLAKEYDEWKVRLVDGPPADETFLESVLRVPADPGGDAWAYRAGEWCRQQMIACELERPSAVPYRQGGVYVVIGGAGGIGEVFSEHVIRNHGARLVWIGRREMSAAIAEKIARLSALGPAPMYLACDATDRDSLEQAYRRIKAAYGQVHGVVHAAIVLLDKSLAQMEEDRFRASLKAKVDVSVRLAQVFAQEALDFVVFFSSLQSFSKAAGQSNYAAGCTFKDAFASRLALEWPSAVKVMNWGYWGSVGIVASEGYRARMAQLGVGSIEPEEGMEALQQLLACPEPQLAFLKTLAPNREARGGLAGERLTQVKQQLPSLVCHLSPGTRHVLAIREKDPRATEAFNELQGHLERLLFSQLQLLGLFVEARTSVGAWERQVGVPAVYSRWLKETRRILGRQGYLHVEGDVCTVADAKLLDNRALWAGWDAGKERWFADPLLGAHTRLMDATLRALPAIITGKRAATDVLFPDSSMALVEGIYKHNAVADYFNTVLADALVEYIEARLRQDPGARLRILEIGAGTGGTSAGIFKRLASHQRSIAEYCYTDLSKAFLMHAEDVYGPSAPYLATRIFNVEQPLEPQRIEAGAYDVVIAANVLHATKQMRNTLRNAKAALKGHGVLLLNELSNNTLFAHLTFGLLEGWWLYEDAELRIPGSPALSPESWRRLLANEGFRSILFPASAAHDYGQQIIVAESDGMIRQPWSGEQRAAAMAASRKPASVVEIRPLVEARPLEEARPPVGARPPVEARPPVAGVKQPDPLTSSSEQRLDMADVSSTIRAAIGRALKIAPGRIQDEASFAEYGVDSIVGVSLIKEINQSFGINLPTTALFDYPTLKSLTKYVTKEHGGTPRSAPQVARAKQPTVSVSAPSSTRSTRRTIAVEAPAKAEAPAPARAPARVEPVSAGHAMYHRVVVSGPGGIDDLEVTQSEVPRVGEQEIQIAVEAFSLNFGDLLCAKGLYPTMPPYPFTPGVEISGTVMEVGSAVRSITRGQPVFALMGENFGGHATVVTCHESQVTAIPRGLSFEQACALPVVAITMIDAFHKAQIKRGEKILIQTATGGTGLIAVQLAKHHGAEICATAGSRRKVEYLKGLGVAHAINYVEDDFEQEVHRLTNGRGVDVVINTLSGDAIQKGLNCLSSGGRYIEIAMTALKSARNIDLSVLSDNQTFYSVDLRKLARSRPERLVDYRREMLELVERGVIGATVSETVSFEEIRTAYRRLENRENIGKVVVTVPESYRYKGAERLQRSAVVTRASGVREPIAIIGMSGRFAKADTVAELWDGLAGGVELTEKVTRWRLREHLEGVLGPEEKHCERGGLLGKIDRFDAEFFNISGLEATYMDPHQRLFLEEGWKALEDAGYVGESIEARRCGVYVGCAGSDYAKLLGEQAPAQAFWGNVGSVISARISYHLNLQGPAITVDTACSGSMVAVHMACQALWSGEIELGLAGGVHVQCTPTFYVLASRAAMLSPQGRCHAFDARADGFVPAEGVGALVLKRLSDAQRDGDHIYGVIRGSGINQDGATNGITAPSALSQERLEREVYDTFQIHPEELQMMEAHGIGAALGDPIEWRALSNAFRQRTPKTQFCAIGSIKTNIGHAAAASGVAGIIKILLAFAHRQMPPSLHFENGNPHIDFENSPFFVNTTLRPWDVVPGRPRCAAVSSFGLSGTNAHMVIEDAPVTERRHAERSGYLIVLSARSAQQLRAQAERLVQHCAANPTLDLGNTSFTLLMGRKHFEHRLACATRSSEELAVLLRAWLDTGATSQVFVSAPDVEPDMEKVREQVSLRRYGEQCIADCCQGGPEDAYLERLSTLADLYSRGYALSFGRLFADGGYARISLPVYPLARDRYWIESSQPSASDSLARPVVHEAVSERARATNGHDRRSREDQDDRREREALEPDAVKDHIVRFLTNELGIAPARVHSNRKLHEIGVDSLMGRRLMRSLEEKFSVHISGKQLLDNPTIGALSAFATQMLPSHGKVMSPHILKPEPPSTERLPDGALDAERMIALIEQGSIL